MGRETAVPEPTVDPAEAVVLEIDKEHDLTDLMAATYRDYPPPWSRMVLLKELGPNEKETYKSLNVHEGSSYYLVCWGGSPDISIGNAGPFVVQK